MVHIKHEIGDLIVTLTAKREGDEQTVYNLLNPDDLSSFAKDLVDVDVALDLNRDDQIEKAVFLLNHFPLPLKMEFLAIPGVVEGLVNKGRREEVIDALCDMASECKGERHPVGREGQLRILTVPGVVACLVQTEPDATKRRESSRCIHSIVGGTGIDGVIRILAVPDARESLKNEADLTLFYVRGERHFQGNRFAECISNPDLMKFLIESGKGKEITETLEFIKDDETLERAKLRALSNFDSAKCLIDAGYAANVVNIIARMQSSKAQAKLLTTEMIETLIEHGHAEGVMAIIEKIGLSRHYKDGRLEDNREVWMRVYDQAEVLSRPNVIRSLAKAGQAAAVVQVIDKLGLARYEAQEGPTYRGTRKVAQKMNGLCEILAAPGSIEGLAEAGFGDDAVRLTKKLPLADREKILSAVGAPTFEAIMGPQRPKGGVRKFLGLKNPPKPA